jgi:hypothetical protein
MGAKAAKPPEQYEINHAAVADKTVAISAEARTDTTATLKLFANAQSAPMGHRTKGSA